jgi:hypothetical protein
MADRLLRLSDEELGRAVASAMAFPAVDVGASVRERLSAPPQVRRLPRPRAVRRAAIAALAAVLLVGGAAVAGRLGVPGLRIIFSNGAPPNLPVGRNLFLGTPATLEDARSRGGFHIRTPHGQGLGPASVYVGSQPPGGRVALVYPPRPGLPRSRFTNAGLLVTEFEASIDTFFVKKVRFSGTRVVDVSVNGSSGFWFAGNPHELEFLDRNGIHFPQSVRLAGHTLVWNDGRITLRLECRCGEARALRIARSMQ